MLQIGSPVRVGGAFTILGVIDGLNAADLERHLGFHAGRLDSGYVLVALADSETLKPDDFELNASTRWSAGHMRRSVYRNISALLDARGQNVDALKAKVAAFFAKRGGTPQPR